MKRGNTKGNFTALLGNDLPNVLFHYLTRLCFIALVTISKVYGVMRYQAVINARFRLFLLREL